MLKRLVKKDVDETEQKEADLRISAHQMLLLHLRICGKKWLIFPRKKVLHAVSDEE